MGGTFYVPPVAQFPSSYSGKYFFGDLCGGWIRAFDPNTGTAAGFATGINSLVDLHVGPDGALYYLTRGGGGQVFRVTAQPARAANISGRARVGTGDQVAISGFIISGNTPKRVVVRALGPSLAAFGATGVLSDPLVELHGSDGSLLATNDNWRETQQTAIQASGYAPTDDRESALLATLPAGNYSAVVRGKGGATGVALGEIYDIDPGMGARLANVSTRAFVGTGADVLIGGFIAGSRIGATRVALRALGPSLTPFGITNALPDPTLTLYNGNGAAIASNDNWPQNAASAALLGSYHLAPPSNLDSALALSLLPGSYTAIVAGKNYQTGVALVEIYDMQ